VKRIPLTKGKFTVVSDSDFDLAVVKWCSFVKGKYAGRNVNGKSILLHRVIACRMGFGNAKEIDHKNGDGLDNRRSNLRPATPSQNHANSRLRQKNPIGQRGITWTKGAWQVVCGRGGYVGRFKSITAAAEAYDKAAREKFGDFAMLNSPDARKQGTSNS
jgi:hypothetical protein